MVGWHGVSVTPVIRGRVLLGLEDLFAFSLIEGRLSSDRDVEAL